MSFYNRHYSRDSKAITSAIERGQITEEDASTILEFIEESRATRHIKDHRAMKSLYDLINWRRFLERPYKDLEPADLYAGINAMMNGESLNGTPFKQNTRHDYIKVLKQFLRWMVERGYSRIPAEAVSRIRIPEKDFQTHEPGDLLTEEEVALERARTDPRNLRKYADWLEKHPEEWES